MNNSTITGVPQCQGCGQRHRTQERGVQTDTFLLPDRTSGALANVITSPHSTCNESPVVPAFSPPPSPGQLYETDQRQVAANAIEASVLQLYMDDEASSELANDQRIVKFVDHESFLAYSHPPISPTLSAPGSFISFDDDHINAQVDLENEMELCRELDKIEDDYYKTLASLEYLVEEDEDKAHTEFLMEQHIAEEAAKQESASSVPPA